MKVRLEDATVEVETVKQGTVLVTITENDVPPGRKANRLRLAFESEDSRRLGRALVRASAAAELEARAIIGRFLRRARVTRSSSGRR